MRQITTNDKNAIKESVSVLQKSGVILYPTDTIYGLGVDATNKEAVEKIVEIKKREEKKTFLVMVRDIEMLKEYAQLNATAQKLVQTFLPGALTLILTSKSENLDSVRRGDGSVGFRIPNHPFCLELTRALQRPIISTSANYSGLATPNSVEGILEQLKQTSSHIDLVIDGGVVKGNQPSTIVDARGEKIKILRSGAVSSDLLSAFL